MFRIDQIITSSQFIRHFRELATHLADSGEPLLITQKNGEFLVVMNGDFFEGLMAARAGECLSVADGGAKSLRVNDE